MRRALLIAWGLLFLAGCQQEVGDHLGVEKRILSEPVVSGRGEAVKGVPRGTVPGASARGQSSATPKGEQRYIGPQAQVGGVPRSWYPSVRPRAWKWIVMHHSDTAVGSAASFDRYHRDVHRWQSLGYDFVIGNGHGSADGLVEVGPRWTRQETGAHAGVLEYNEYGIGICLVGDFQSGRPTQAQLRSLAKLNAFLMKTYRIPAERIIGHREAKHGKTNCPGRNLSIASVRTMATHVALGENSILGEALAEMSEWAWEK